MLKTTKTLSRANDGLRPEGLPGLSAILGHAPQLTRNWGPCRAFLTILTVVTILAIVVRPETALIICGIYVFAIVAGLLATYMRWID